MLGKINFIERGEVEVIIVFLVEVDDVGIVIDSRWGFIVVLGKVVSGLF